MCTSKYTCIKSQEGLLYQKQKIFLVIAAFTLCYFTGTITVCVCNIKRTF